MLIPYSTPCSGCSGSPCNVSLTKWHLKGGRSSQTNRWDSTEVQINCSPVLTTLACVWVPEASLHLTHYPHYSLVLSTCIECTLCAWCCVRYCEYRNKLQFLAHRRRQHVFLNPDVQSENQISTRGISCIGKPNGRLWVWIVAKEQGIKDFVLGTSSQPSWRVLIFLAWFAAVQGAR